MSSDEARKAMARSFGDWLGEVPDGTTLHVDGIPVSVELAREAYNPAMAEFVEKARRFVDRDDAEVINETFHLVSPSERMVALDPARVTIVRDVQGEIVGYLYQGELP